MTVSQSLDFEAIGTKWTIHVGPELSASNWEKLKTQIADRIEQFDKTYSRFRKDSWVTKLSKQADTYEVPDDAWPLLDFYKQLYDVTDGLVTPLIGQVVSDAGYDATYSLTSKVLQEPPKWEEVLSYAEGSITLKQSALLDFGAAGKGYLVDIIGKILNEAGISKFVINAGGDILHHSQANEAIEIGLEHPFDTLQVLGTVVIGNQSLCASAGSKRAWENHNHIINPKTLESPRNTAATWVVADEAMYADGLATALFFVRPEALAKEFRFACAILDNNMGLEYSQDLKIKLFEDGA